MAEQTRTFSGVDRAKMDHLREAIAPYVQLPPGDSATIESRGVKGRFHYDERAQTLTITVDEAPFFIPITMIWNGVQQALSSA
ncbi:MAG: hypothetical protein JO165_01930 [Candidatus Eremiobacteraeota bacterium]|nr:hypothetical protein [Candidatus Eremiobacteraeota bacterium]